MRDVRTHIGFIIRSIINLDHRRRVVSLSLLIFCLVAGVRLFSISVAGAPPGVPDPPRGLDVSVVS